jgi:hypothetical protein
MNPELVRLWQEYRRALVDLFRGEVGVALVEPDGEAVAALLGRAAELTEAFRRELAPDVEAERAYELETAVLATAALDVAVGSELIVSGPREEGPPPGNEGWREILPPPARRHVPAPEELESIEELLWRADAAFGEGMATLQGAAPDFSMPQARAQEGIDQILDLSLAPTAAFTRGLLLTELDTLQVALDLFPGVAEIPVRHHRLRIPASLFAQAIEKLLTLMRSDSITDLVNRFGLHGLAGALQFRVRGFGKAVTRKMVRAGQAEMAVSRLLDAAELDEPHALALDSDLSVLCLRYGKNMRSAETVSKWMRFAAPGIVWLGGLAPGRIAVGTVNGVGLAYCLFSCADRLDTVPGWVPGVPALVERNLP